VISGHFSDGRFQNLNKLVIEFILRFATLSLPGKFKDNFAIVLIVLPDTLVIPKSNAKS
jgi:hypothetical protein